MNRWALSHRADPIARALADRHYNRQKVGATQFVPPGRCIVLLTDRQDAFWITSFPYAEYVKHAWAGAMVCTAFRNEGDYLSSELITEAVAISRWKWPELHPLGMVSFVNADKVRRKRDPGRCFKRAGWTHVGFTAKDNLWVYQILPEDMPPPLEPLPFPGENPPPMARITREATVNVDVNLVHCARALLPDAPVFIDTETTGLSPWHGDVIRDIQIGIGEDIFHLPLTRPHSANVPRQDVIDLLAKIAADRPLLVFANAKFDISMILADLGVDLSPCPIWDVLTGAWLEDENHPAKGLKDRANFLFPDIGATAERDDLARLTAGPTLKCLEDALYAASRLFGATKVTRAQCNEMARQRPEYGRREMWDLTADEIHPYACRDIDLTRRLYHYQTSLDHKHPIAAAMPREMQVMRILLGMERTGILVDTARAESSHAAALSRLEELATTFEGINPDSNPQLQELVYEKWGFPILARTPAGAPSTARATLELLGDDPRIVSLLEWRRLSKAVSAYYRPLLEKADGNGRVHVCYRQTGTKTGRFSAGEPGPVLQCIPREDTDSEVRALFRPAPGYALVGFDLAQAEVRWAAALSRDPALIEACQHTDVYSVVAAQMGVKRDRAKQAVLANNYGAGAPQLAATLLKGSGRMVTPADVRAAADLQHRLRLTYPQMARATDALEQTARRDGRFPLHPPGRYRHFRGAGHAPEEYRKAWNSACQGGIGELMKDLMITLAAHEVWRYHGATPLLQIHDELLAEVPPENITPLAKQMQAVLDDINPLPAVRQLIEIKMWREACSPSATLSAASAGSRGPSMPPGSAPSSSPSPTPSAAPSSAATGPASPATGTSAPSPEPGSAATASSPTASSEDSPARTSASPEPEQASQANAPASSSSSPASSKKRSRSGSSSKTSPVSCLQQEDGTWEFSFPRWSTSGTASPGECSTLSTSEWPNDAAVCSLSDILETGDVPQKYFLSPRAAAGILRRAERRGRKLPEPLAVALATVVGATTSTGPPSSPP